MGIGITQHLGIKSIAGRVNFILMNRAYRNFKMISTFKDDDLPGTLYDLFGFDPRFDNQVIHLMGNESPGFILNHK